MSQWTNGRLKEKFVASVIQKELRNIILVNTLEPIDWKTLNNFY